LARGVDAVKPESHVESSPLGAFASCDVDDGIERGALLGRDRGEDFDDVGGFLDDGDSAGGKSSATSSCSFSRNAARYSPTGSVVTRGRRPDARMMPGILSRTSLPTPSVLFVIMRLVQLYRRVLTSMVCHGK
jgi:hypothetical protein